MWLSCNLSIIMFGSMNTYTSMLDKSMELEKISVSIIGTGPFGLALATRLSEGGASVWLGTRDINSLRCEVPGSISVVKTREALRVARVVILAIPGQFQRTLPLSELRPGTVVVDCSNRSSKVPEGKLTHVEEMARVFPTSVSIVKAFNTLEVMDLVGDKNVVKDVPVASDNPSARVLVNTLVTLLGHRPIDYGDLKGARRMENMPLILFPGYRKPFFLSFSCWLVLHLLTWLRSVLCQHGQKPWGLQEVALNIFSAMNRTSSSHSLLMLAVAQFPLVVTDYVYLIRGTKYIILPPWLLAWTDLRIKLFPLLFISLLSHGWLALFLSNNSSVSSLSSLPPGVLSYLSLLFLCLSLHPAISSFMSRYEKTVTVSLLSWSALLLSTMHCIMSGWDKLAFMECLPSSHQLSLILPTITIFLQIPLMLPWIRKKLVNIQRGHVYRGIYERKL